MRAQIFIAAVKAEDLIFQGATFKLSPSAFWASAILVKEVFVISRRLLLTNVFKLLLTA